MTIDSTEPAIPDGFELTRTTDVFDNDTVPAGLLRAHRVATGVWGRFIVYTGLVTFVFEDTPDQAIGVSANEHVVVPPARPHQLELNEPSTFAVEFYREPSAIVDDQRQESSALE